MTSPSPSRHVVSPQPRSTVAATQISVKSKVREVRVQNVVWRGACNGKCHHHRRDVGQMAKSRQVRAERGGLMSDDVLGSMIAGGHAGEVA